MHGLKTHKNNFLSMLGSLRELEFSFMGQLRMLLVTRTHSMIPMEPSHIPVAPPLLAECQKMPGSYRGKDNQGWERPACR